MIETLCTQGAAAQKKEMSKKKKKALTSIQHLGLPAFVPHTIIVSFTFWMTVMKLSHSSWVKKRQWKQKIRPWQERENPQMGRGIGHKSGIQQWQKKRQHKGRNKTRGRHRMEETQTGRERERWTGGKKKQAECNTKRTKQREVQHDFTEIGGNPCSEHFGREHTGGLALQKHTAILDMHH